MLCLLVLRPSAVCGKIYCLGFVVVFACGGKYELCFVPRVIRLSPFVPIGDTLNIPTELRTIPLNGRNHLPYIER